MIKEEKKSIGDSLGGSCATADTCVVMNVQQIHFNRLARLTYSFSSHFSPLILHVQVMNNGKQSVFLNFLTTSKNIQVFRRFLSHRNQRALSLKSRSFTWKFCETFIRKFKRRCSFEGIPRISHFAFMKDWWVITWVDERVPAEFPSGHNLRVISQMIPAQWWRGKVFSDAKKYKLKSARHSTEESCLLLPHFLPHELLRNYIPFTSHPRKKLSSSLEHFVCTKSDAGNKSWQASDMKRFARMIFNSSLEGKNKINRFASFAFTSSFFLCFLPLRAQWRSYQCQFLNDYV